MCASRWREIGGEMGAVRERAVNVCAHKLIHLRASSPPEVINESANHTSEQSLCAHNSSLRASIVGASIRIFHPQPHIQKYTHTHTSRCCDVVFVLSFVHKHTHTLIGMQRTTLVLIGLTRGTIKCVRKFAAQFVEKHTHPRTYIQKTYTHSNCS